MIICCRIWSSNAHAEEERSELVRDGICVDPPLCRGTSQGKYSSRTKGHVRVGEIVEKIGEVGERELVIVGQCQVRQGMRHDTWMTFVLRHKDVQS